MGPNKHQKHLHRKGNHQGKKKTMLRMGKKILQTKIHIGNFFSMNTNY